MERKAVITGIGLITPGGTLSNVWETLLCGQSVASPIETFDTSLYPTSKAGIVTDSAIFASFSPRLLKRMDRFACLALAATQQALQDSGLDDVSEAERQSVGVYMGNMYAGWGILNPDLHKRYRDISPYAASGWFPTASQGQMTIQWELGGYSKSIVADTASSLLAIGYAARAIEEGRANIMLAGGAEAPITPFTYSCCVRSGRLSPDGYHVFDPEGKGFLVGEGAIVLVLEELRAAQQRHARIYAEIAGWATGYLPQQHGPWSDEGKRLSRVIAQALKNAATTPDTVDYLGLDAQGLFAADRVEAQAIAYTFETAGQQPVVTTCKPTLTHLLGAAAGTEIATALLAMHHEVIPPIAGYPSHQSAYPLELVVGKPREHSIHTALILARGTDGVQSAIVLKKS
jgi:3-oxoacyl-[acyl-carrier-protein] synthase II